MLFKRNVSFGFICLLIICGLSRIAKSTSVYCITIHIGSTVQVYGVDGDEIEWQLKPGNFPSEGAGAVDLALDGESDTLFASYDNSNKIQLVNSKTMEPMPGKSINAPGEIAGMVFDAFNHRLLALKREGRYLYAYDYNDGTLGNEKIILLENLSFPYAFGVCLDEHENILYVSDKSNIVKYYDSSDPDFGYLGSVEIEEGGKGYEAVGIDVYNDDQGHRYLYSGAWIHGGIHNCLVRTDLNIEDPNDPNYIIVKDIDTSVLGVAVDKEAEYSGLVYVTTSNNQVAVYDTSGWTSDPEQVIEPTDVEGDDVWGPAGIVVGSQYKAPQMSIEKDDGVDPNEVCGVVPDEEITYTITFAPDPNDHTNVYVRDYLPLEVEFISADPNDGEYDEDSHTYTWYIGDVDGGDPSVELELVVRVMSVAEPFSIITNEVEIESDTSYTRATEKTKVCCWGDDIIYVDSRATGFNTGTCWDDAYVRLESALARAKTGCGDEIWVAGGTYLAGSSSADSFEIADGVEIYGGFAGDETSKDDRDFYRNKTFLHGDEICSKVVTAEGVDSTTILDGFIIGRGIQYGIYCYNSDMKISNCVVIQNGGDGIRCQGSGYSPTIERSIIYENDYHGIYSLQCNPTILNCWIHHNGNDEIGNGVYLYAPSGVSTIRNNTIVYNIHEGIYKTSNGTNPAIVNDILWHNNSDNGYLQLTNCDAVYCCITDPSDPDGDDEGASTPDGDNNITCNPLFAYSDPTLYNFHLDPNSPCIDMGDNTSVDPNEVGEKDIDGDDRIINWTGIGSAIVDMGADEVACGDVYDEWDFNADGIINLHDFSGMADAWLKDDEDLNWIDTYQKYDLVENGQIDLADLNALVCYEDDEKWLWEACWFSPDTLMMMGMDGGMDKAMAAAAMTDEQIEQAKLDKWYKTRPPHVMTVWEEIKLVEESLDWLEKVWLEDEQLRKEVSPEEWKEFINSLYDWLAQMKEQSAK